MAGQAEKKLKKAGTDAWRFYGAFATAVTALHFGVLMFSHVSKKRWIMGFLSALCNFGLVAQLSSSAGQGIKSVAYYQDMYAVNLAAQCFGCFSAWGWCLWLLVPAYATYKIGRLVVGWVMTPEPEKDVVPGAKKKYKKKYG